MSNQGTDHLRRALAGEAPRESPVQLRPAALHDGRLHEVAGDWLFAECSPEGRAKLLREHRLLAA